MVTVLLDKGLTEIQFDTSSNHRSHCLDIVTEEILGEGSDNNIFIIPSNLSMDLIMDMKTRNILLKDQF